MLLAAVLAGAAGVGVAAQALGSLVERLVLAAGWRAWPWPLRPLAARQAEHGASRGTPPTPRTTGSTTRPNAPVRRGRAWTPPNDTPRTGGGLASPWNGRNGPRGAAIASTAVATRLDRDLNLDLATVWPYLWLTLPDTARGEITAVRQALTRATTLTAWALLYLPLAYWWWPAVPTAAVLAVTAWRRIRTAVDTYAHLVEATATPPPGGTRGPPRHRAHRTAHLRTRRHPHPSPANPPPPPETPSS